MIGDGRMICFGRITLTTSGIFGRGAAALVVTAAGMLSMPGSAHGQGNTTPAADPGLPAGEPTFRDILSLRSVASPLISPDGRRIAFVRRVPDWEENGSVQELWIDAVDGGPLRLATEEDGFRGGAQWTPDSQWLAFPGAGDAPALKLVSPDGRPARTLELGVDGARTVRFSPDGTTLAVLAREPASDRDRREQELYGPFEFRDEARRDSHVWLLPAEGGGAPRQLTHGDFTVTEMAWSPDGTRLAFVRQADAGRNSWWTADIALVDVASGRVQTLVDQPGPDRGLLWSPDGSAVAFLSTLADSITNLPMELATVPAEGGQLRVLTDDLATQPNPLAWTAEGIWLTALQGVENHLFRLDPASGSLTRLTHPPYLVGQASVSAEGSAVALLASTPDRLGEVHRAEAPGFSPRAVTDVTAQVEGWAMGTREVVTWTGPGGVTIEGVLHRPDDYELGRRYPLLVVVHGGPRAVSTPALRLTSSGVYPIVHFLRKGALVLEPNYRGSTGYGGEFRQLHRRALGWGDAGDVEAGVAHLVAEGRVDPDRVGLMGWSYGGFISAYLTATSKAFRAVSVGAGISDWRTHYAWEPSSYTTRFYSFDAAPWEDPNAYDVASPITYINNASTPTLIQHVDGDPVVTVLNAYELQHALQDLGVENRFVIYPGSSHGVGPLKQRLGGLWHNWQWFLEHIWDERVELPLEPPGT
jgi:dipeptidyl aminopeptidase/acylaminoacyl peptidase